MIIALIAFAVAYVVITAITLKVTQERNELGWLFARTFMLTGLLMMPVCGCILTA